MECMGEELSHPLSVNPTLLKLIMDKISRATPIAVMSRFKERNTTSESVFDRL